MQLPVAVMPDLICPGCTFCNLFYTSQDGIAKETAAKSAAAASEEDAWAKVKELEIRCTELEGLLKASSRSPASASYCTAV